MKAALLALAVLALPRLCADSPPAVPAPTPAVAPLRLKDGRTFHEPRVVSVEADSVVFNTREGLVKIPKSNLTDAELAQLPAPKAPKAGTTVMQPFDLNPQPTPGPTQFPNPAPRPRPTPAPRPTPGLVYRGCTITSYTMKPFDTVQGCVEVSIENNTDAPVALHPYEITVVLTSGSLMRGHKFVVESYPPMIHNQDAVPPRGTLTEIVTFSNDPIEIANVRWSR